MSFLLSNKFSCFIFSFETLTVVSFVKKESLNELNFGLAKGFFRYNGFILMLLLKLIPFKDTSNYFLSNFCVKYLKINYFIRQFEKSGIKTSRLISEVFFVLLLLLCKKIHSSRTKLKTKINEIQMNTLRFV
jgi:hypothetical protein